MIDELYKRIRYYLFAPMPTDRKSKPVKDRIRKMRYLLFGQMFFLGRKFTMGGTSDARKRRKREGFFEKYCRGKGLDVGYGGDPVVPSVRGWDFEHGDAQLLHGLDDESFDFVYSSHLLEHLPDVELALNNWWRVLKPSGCLILYLPHRDLYEKKAYLPSRFNDDHVHFFLPEQDELPDTLGVLPLIKRVLDEYELIYCKTCDEGYVNLGDELHSEGEFSIELVIRKSA